MHVKNLIRTACGGLFLLFISHVDASLQDLDVKYVTMPAWNIITDTLNDMTPKVEGTRNDFLMTQICNLARGDTTLQDTGNILRQNNIDPGKIPLSGSPLSLLVNDDQFARQSACAAYIATSLFQAIDTNKYFENVKYVAGKNNQESPDIKHWGFFKARVSNGDKSATSENKRVFDFARFNQDTRVKMAIAQSTAQLYALIAGNISNSAALTWPEYQKQVRFVVDNYAQDYLQSINMHYQSDAKKPLTISDIQPKTFTVENNTGDKLMQSGSSLKLLSDGVIWFGEGKILGKEYFVNMTIIGSNKSASIPPPAKAEKGKGYSQ